MKRFLKGLFLFIIGFMIIPMVHAEQEIPTEGVHYFLTYPNNEQVISENYEDVTDEKLLYSGTTNANGEVILNNWQDSGRIRVVQVVPSGYQTDVESMSIDLSNGKAEFVDYKKISNPHTGQSLLFLLVIGGVLGGAYFTVRSPKKKKVLMMIPVAALAIVSLKVFADNQFTIVVKDKQGNRLANVEVLVYGAPSTVEAAPAVIFSANGGTFYDGTTEMIFKLPSANCNYDEFVSSLSDDDNAYLYDNADGATRDGYYPDGFDYPDKYSDGTVVNMIWVQAQMPKVVTVEGNGGTLEFDGRILSSVNQYNYNYYDLYYTASEFTNGNNFFIGIDDNPSCSHFDASGNISEDFELDEDVDTVYACWNSKPDGIYVDGELFQGSDTNCFEPSYFNPQSENGFMLSNSYYEIGFLEVDNENLFITPAYGGIKSMDDDGLYSTIEIVKDGQTVLLLEENDLSYSDDDGFYHVTNASKLNSLINYFSGLFDNDCFNSENQVFLTASRK